MNDIIFIGTEAGTILEINLNEGRILSQWKAKDGAVLGLKRDGDFLYASSKSVMYKLRLPGYEKVAVKACARRPEFHHLLVRPDYVYFTATRLNEIWRTDLDFGNLEVYRVKPPMENAPVKRKSNYNHLNNIFFHENRFWVNLNWFTTVQYHNSGVAVFDKDMNELERFEYGWETHAFCWLDGKKFALCAVTGNDRKIRHPKKAGLLVDNELVFEHDTDVFCKYFIRQDDHYYLVGGTVVERDARQIKDGIIFVLDNNFSLVNIQYFCGTGGFCGCTI